MTLELPGRTRSKKNSKRRIRCGRNVFMVPSQQHADWHRDMSLLLASQRSPKPIERCDVSIMLYTPDRREGDLSNKAESIMDLLVDCGFLADDNWFVVPHLALAFGGVDRERPKVIVEIAATGRA